MRAWITRYALTKGVYEEDVEPTSYPGMVQKTTEWVWYHKPDWHETQAEAVTRAEEMRVAKIRALTKQLAKLEKMRFEEPAKE